MKTKKRPVGFRVGDLDVTLAAKVIDFEIKELGNVHLQKEAKRFFGLRTIPTRTQIRALLRQRYGKKGRAIWLTRTRRQAETRYGPGKADRYVLPTGARIFSDLGEEGQLWIFGPSSFRQTLLTDTKK